MDKTRNNSRFHSGNIKDVIEIPKDLEIEEQLSDDENSTCDKDTVADEEFAKLNMYKIRREKLPSWPNTKVPNADPRRLNLLTNEGPNINLKLPRRSYSSSEEKDYFFNKIRTKKKTELCKNWSLYSDCYFKDTCSFAHGENELRQNQIITEKYKTKICKMFNENYYCHYGNRCIYLHIIK